tara:strand:+ start:3635 stop:3808 length:174 start_codon:yes stop_codon:yes gene_type:complete
MNNNEKVSTQASVMHRKTDAEQIKALFEKAERRKQRRIEQNIKVDFDSLEKVYEGWV